ncbi:hypothetical protein AA11826_0359 [Komagataeibacter oboediens DSM 11826]|uniref:Uncharacterized protein n=1 Tax=Komagataeibacter oboediens TaxID=65958 RepID=A0A318R5C9_9PROT|nr:hypothetical protein [Komagataeibacter oboediens]PYD81323.1 hypothetical protein CFR80_12310 [Komagataeibacter oboediens]GBR28827.1 hypothetical protein AA11826_0359 [Komagataeibacter oboediens DSM 11826]
MSDWNGLPDQPERSGWYWLAGRYYPDMWVLDLWNGKTRMWGDGTMSPELCAQRCIYGGPVLTPPELAQMRKDERGRAAKVAQEISVHYYALGDAAENDVDVVAFEERMFAADECAVAIRALTDDEGKKS